MMRVRHYHDGPLECWISTGLIGRSWCDRYRFKCSTPINELTDRIISFYQSRHAERVEQDGLLRFRRRCNTVSCWQGELWHAHDTVIKLDTNGTCDTSVTVTYEMRWSGGITVRLGETGGQAEMKRLMVHILGKPVAVAFAKLAARRRRRVAVALGLVLTAIIAGGIAWFAPRMAPVRKGNSADFWYTATYVEIEDQQEGRWGGDTLLEDDVYYYTAQHMHGSILYRLPAQEALADFPRALEAIEARVQEADDDDFDLRQCDLFMCGRTNLMFDSDGFMLQPFGVLDDDRGSFRHLHPG